MQKKVKIEVLVESLVLMKRIVAALEYCSLSQIVASPYYGMKILVAAASDRTYKVYIWLFGMLPLVLLPIPSNSLIQQS